MKEIEAVVEKLNVRLLDFANLHLIECRLEYYEHHKHVEKICQTFESVFEECGIPIRESAFKINPLCAKAMKYLILITKFDWNKIGKRLQFERDAIQDLISSEHPKISTYLFTEIVWDLGYENILLESLLWIHPYLTFGIYKAVKKSIYLLSFQRRLNFVVMLVENCYKNLEFAWKNGAPSANIFELLMMWIREFLLLLSNANFLKLNEVDSLEKSERIGLVLKSVMKLTKICLKKDKTDVSSQSEIADLYRLTVVDEQLEKYNDSLVDKKKTLDQEFVVLMNNMADDLEDETLENWSEIETAGNSNVPLDLSIRLDFLEMIEFLKSSEHLSLPEYLIGYTVELLEELMPEDVSIPATLKLNGLRCEETKLDRDSMKNLMHRYKEWDHETFEFIRKNSSLIHEDDISSLFDYLALIIEKPCQQDHKQKVAAFIRTILWREQIDTGPERKVRKTVSNPQVSREEYDDWKNLNASYTAEKFTEFVANNVDVTSMTSLKTTLMFLLNNPLDSSRILVEILMGVPVHANTEFNVEDLILLYPVINIRDGNGMGILLALRNALCYNEEWDENKLTHFVQVLMNKVFTLEQYINQVFYHWLTSDIKENSTLVRMLKCVRKLKLHECTKMVNVEQLCLALAARIVDIRNDGTIPRSIGNLLIEDYRLIATVFVNLVDENFRWDLFPHFVDPIDRGRPPFSRTGVQLWDDFGMGIIYSFKFQFMQGLRRERRKIDGEVNIRPDEPQYTSDLKPLHNDFIRYTMIKCSETEYISLAAKLAQDNKLDVESNNNGWPVLNVDDELYDRYSNVFDGYDKIVHITIEAAIYFLEFPGINPPESFACLMKGLAGFTSAVVNREVMILDKRFHVSVSSAENLLTKAEKLREQYSNFNRILRKNLTMLKETIKHSVFSIVYESLIQCADNPTLVAASSELEFHRLKNAVENFANDCSKIPHDAVKFRKETSPRAAKYKFISNFIDECLNSQFASRMSKSRYHPLCATFKMLCEQSSDIDKTAKDKS